MSARSCESVGVRLRDGPNSRDSIKTLPLPYRGLQAVREHDAWETWVLYTECGFYINEALLEFLRNDPNTRAHGLTVSCIRRCATSAPFAPRHCAPACRVIA